jgi:hypothetical protein
MSNVPVLAYVVVGLTGSYYKHEMLPASKALKPIEF